nr:hypothetical protein [Mycobacterium intracellulare]
MREIDGNGRCHGAMGRYRALHRFGGNRGGWDAKSGYRASIALARSEERARRPKTGKLKRCNRLRAEVEALLVKKYSPEQIAGALAKTYPDRPEMQVSHETIYKAVYVQGRGELRRELATCLRIGRALRKPTGRRTNTEHRRYPGHGQHQRAARRSRGPRRARALGRRSDHRQNQASQIGTLVERSTGFVQLLHLPQGRSADVVAQAMITAGSVFTCR